MSVRRFALRLWTALRGRAGDNDRARELAAHRALLEDDYLRRGMTPDAAGAAAQRALGSAALAADRCRDAASFAWIDDLRWDARYALRLLRRNPLFALTAIVSLAIGIGANTAVFTIGNALLFQDPSGVASPSRLVDIGSSKNGYGFSTISYPTYLDVAARTQTLDGV